MLKIRDGIDLKELEKYGYKKGTEMCNISFSCYGKEFKSQLDKILKLNIENPLILIQIHKKSRIIELLITKEYSPRAFSYDREDIIKPYIDDLIKDGLVEKVGE